MSIRSVFGVAICSSVLTSLPVCGVTGEIDAPSHVATDEALDASKILDDTATCGRCVNVHDLADIGNLCLEKEIRHFDELYRCLCDGPCHAACNWDAGWCPKPDVSALTPPSETCALCASVACSRPLKACGD